MNHIKSVFFLLIWISIASCVAKKHIATTKKSSTEQTPKNLQTAINSWINVPYKYGGNDKQGVDCSGFVNAIYLSVYKIKLPRTTKEIFKISSPIKKEDLKEGDLVFFKNAKNEVSHVGIFLEKNKFVHSSSSKGVTISLLNNSYYKNHFIRGGRVR